MDYDKLLKMDHQDKMWYKIISNSTYTDSVYNSSFRIYDKKIQEQIKNFNKIITRNNNLNSLLDDDK